MGNSMEIGLMEVKNGILLPVSFELLLYARIFDSDDEHQLIY